jgi:hypothetical protein
MFTLKLYRNGPLPPSGRTIILETVGLWVNHCEGDVKHILAFKKKVGVQDEDGTPEFYVGGTPIKYEDLPKDAPSASFSDRDDNYFGWGVLENAQGKTTEMFR